MDEWMNEWSKWVALKGNALNASFSFVVSQILQAASFSLHYLQIVVLCLILTLSSIWLFLKSCIIVSLKGFAVFKKKLLSLMHIYIHIQASQGWTCTSFKICCLYLRRIWILVQSLIIIGQKKCPKLYNLHCIFHVHYILFNLYSLGHVSRSSIHATVKHLFPSEDYIKFYHTDSAGLVMAYECKKHWFIFLMFLWV